MEGSVHMIKKFLSYALMVVFTIIVLPVFITLLYSGRRNTYNVNAAQDQEYIAVNKNDDKSNDNVDQIQQQVTVYNPGFEIIEDVGIERYVKGVVAAEMPVSFEIEALKAQAVAARTYALRAMAGNSDIEPKDIGQAYLDEQQLRQKWGENYSAYWLRVSQAVDQTKAEVITYNDEMILAAFHSTSAGYTENSENIWSQTLPYLKSVESKQDENAPGFITQKTMSQNELITRLKNKYADIKITKSSILSQIQIVSRSKAGYILELQVGNKVLTGREIRELLALKSSDFTIKQQGDQVIFTTKGYGHGVGMSQYGANYMAKAGSRYDEILKHYYQGVEIVKYHE
jgi:stage II sporulation protein D